MNKRTLALSGIVLTLCASTGVHAQENYEIQVYGSETMPAGITMFELHSNFTITGRRQLAGVQLPTYHAFHETVEITHGFGDWAEIGFYFFTSARSGDGWQWVGDHIRPRVRVPPSWHWPVGASLSAEFGYQRSEFSEDTWSLELRPIIDRDFGPAYVSLNPTLERSFRGANSGIGFEFSPNAVVGVDVNRVLNVGVEYYGSLGPLRALDPVDEQEHQLYAAVNLNVSPDWEINAGYGQGLTGAGDRRLIKLILGRRVGHSR